MDQKDIEQAREHFKHEYRVAIDNFGEEKHPEKIAMYKIAIEVLEKFIPKQPKKEGLADWYCPACKAWIKYDSLNMPRESAPKRCDGCGQVLNWRK